MKIIVVSDTHGNYDLLQKIYLKHQDAKYFFHLGDSELPENYLFPFLIIKGNCDYFLNAPEKLTINYEFGKAHLEHGNKIPFIIFDSYVKSLDVDYFFYGHTHQKSFEIVGKTYVFNPGSLTKPRDDNEGSYLIIEIDDQNNKFLNYKFMKASSL